MKKDIAFELHKIAIEQGSEFTSRQCIEEMSELMQALNKLWRHQRTWDEVFTDSDVEEIENTLLTNVTEEIADVLITIENIKYLLSIPDSKINDMIKYKIDRYNINKMH